MSLIKDEIELKLEQAQFGANQALSSVPKSLKWFAVVFLLAAIPGYFLVKSLSHSYWSSRYKGLVLSAHKSFTDAVDPSISQVTITTAGPDIYTAAAKITNNNLDLSADNVSYEFDFYNEKSELLKTASGKLFLLPGESKYLVVPRVESSEKIASAEVKLPGTLPWQKRITIPQVSLSVSQPNYYNQTTPLAFVVEGALKNQSPYLLGRVTLTFLLYDAQGKLLAASEREESALKPGELRTYKQLWPGIYSTDVVKATVLTGTDTLDPENLTLLQSGSSSSDLGR